MVLTLLGPTLQNLMDPWHQFNQINLAESLLNAIEAFHSIGYVHADIKPANIAFTSETDHRPILFDFGLAKYLGEKTSKKASFGGSPMYTDVLTHWKAIQA